MSVPSAADVRAQVEQLLASATGALPIVQAGDPVLRRPAARYEGQLDDATLAALLVAMRRTMVQAPGVGLAAPQIGLGLALAVVEDTWPVDDETAEVRERTPVPYRVLVNPTYTPVGDEQVGFYEGCLSVEGWQAVTPRWRSIRLTCTDEHGDPVDEVLVGWPARIVQHETDHLRGRLYVDVAEMRSLVAPPNCLRWAEASPAAAGRALGFDLPQA